MNLNFKKLVRTILIILTFTTIAFFGWRIGFNYTKDAESLKKPQNKLETNSISSESLVDGEEKLNDEVILLPLDNNEKRVGDNTILVHEYYYTDDGKFEIEKEEAPYFLIGKNEDDIKNLYKEWNLISFDEKEIVLRKEVKGPTGEQYIVGIMDGYITVFNKETDNGDNVKEITSTPVSVLPIEEQEKLLHGIEISGDEELIRFLEDYSS